MHKTGGSGRARRPVMLVSDSLLTGGAERSVLELAREFKRRRIPVMVVIVRLGGEMEREYTRAGIEWLVLGDVRHGLGASIISRLVRLMRVHAPLIVHSHVWVSGIVGRAAARYARVPVIMHTHRDTRAGQPPMQRALEPWLDRVTHKHVGVSDYVVNELRAAHAIAESDIMRIYNGIDLEPFLAVPELSADAVGARLVSVGNLKPGKGQRMLIDAMPKILNEIPTAQLDIYGSGVLEQELRAVVESKGLASAVHFHGRIDAPQDAYQAGDVVVVPSEHEGFSRVAAEAMTSARPVVATHVGGIPEVVADGETGTLVPPRDVDAMAAACVAMLNDRTRARTYGAAGRARARTMFAPERMADEYIELYRTCLNDCGVAWPYLD